MEFEWDDQKAERNSRKHGVSFTEAATVFEDPLSAIIPDDEHSYDERREIIIGHSASGRILFVSFVVKPDDRFRIISARQATRLEKKRHEEAKF